MRTWHPLGPLLRPFVPLFVTRLVLQVAFRVSSPILLLHVCHLISSLGTGATQPGQPAGSPAAAFAAAQALAAGTGNGLVQNGAQQGSANQGTGNQNTGNQGTGTQGTGTQGTGTQGTGTQGAANQGTAAATTPTNGQQQPAAGQGQGTTGASDSLKSRSAMILIFPRHYWTATGTEAGWQRQHWRSRCWPGPAARANWFRSNWQRSSRQRSFQWPWPRTSCWDQCHKRSGCRCRRCFQESVSIEKCLVKREECESVVLAMDHASRFVCCRYSDNGGEWRDGIHMWRMLECLFSCY